VQLPSRATRANTESGSALILLPLIAMVVVILTTLAINAASLYLAQHQLTQVAEACAIQGTRALDPSSYYSRGVLTLSPSTARQDVTSCVYNETSTNTSILVSYPAPLSLTVRLTQPQRAPLLAIMHIDQGIITASATASAVPSTPIAPARA
jgi:hypothetical protein